MLTRLALSAALVVSGWPRVSDPVDELLSGVEEITAPGTPGGVCAFGPEAFVVLTDRSGVPVVAGARVGKGRALAFGHNGYMSRTAFEVADTGRLVLNSLRWLSGGKRKPRVACPGRDGLAQALSDLGVRAEESDQLAGFDCVVIDLGAALTRKRMAEISDFVHSGGGLLAATTGWGWQQLNPGRQLARDLPGNRILVPFGLAFSLETTTKTSEVGFTTQPRPSPTSHAGRALEELLAGALPEAERARALARVRAALDCLPDHEPSFVLPLRARLEGEAVAELEPLVEHYGQREWRPLGLYFGEWHAIGPFAAKDVKQSSPVERLLRDLGPGGKGPNLSASLRGKGGGLDWNPLELKSDGLDLDVGVVRFDQLFGGSESGSRQTERAAAYLYRTIHVGAERELFLILGSDDGMRLWCNGELVVDRKESLGIELEEVETTLRLQAGLNHLLVKVANVEGVWGFRMRASSTLEQTAIDAAIRRGVDALIEDQHIDGSWSNAPQYGPGYTAFCVYTLLKCGVSRDHPAVQRGMAYALSREPEHTYSSSCVILAMAAHARGQAHPGMEEAVARLLAWQDRLGLYAYPVHPDGQTLPIDLSNTLLATLALRAAAGLGIEIDDEVWEGLIRGALRCHEQTDTDRSGKPLPGGFSYRVGGRPATGSMTTAGLSVLLIGREALGRRLDRRLEKELEVALASGLAWLEGHMEWTRNPGADGWQFFYLYGVERLGSLLERDVIGKFDWYRSGSEYLIGSQSEDGRWKAEDQHADKAYDTLLALLFLGRATAPRSGERSESPRDLYTAEGPDQALSLRVKGIGPLEVWITGWGEWVREQFASPGSLREPRIERVRYFARRAGGGEERLLAEVTPREGSEVQRFEARVELAEAGTYEIYARADALASRSEGSPDPEPTELASGVIRVSLPAPATEESLRYALDPARNLIATRAARVEASSHAGAHDAALAIDGKHATRWSSGSDDAQPWWRAEFARPVRARRVLFSHAFARGVDHARPQPALVEVSLDGKHTYELSIGSDPMRKSELVFPEDVELETLEVRIVSSRNGTLGSVEVGFSEIELVDE